MTDPQLSYEQAVEEFDKRLRALEDGNLSLEAAVTAVQEASVFLKTCYERLEEAKRKIEVRPATADESPEPAVAAVPPGPEVGDSNDLFSP